MNFMGLQVIDLDHFGRQRIPHFFVDSSRHFMSDLMSDHSFAETIHRQLRKSSLVALSRNKTGVLSVSLESSGLPFRIANYRLVVTTCLCFFFNGQSHCHVLCSFRLHLHLGRLNPNFGWSKSVLAS